MLNVELYLWQNCVQTVVIGVKTPAEKKPCAVTSTAAGGVSQ